MEILNCDYAAANLIRAGKLAQLYSILQTKTKDLPGERMITLENHIVKLIKSGQVDLKEGRKCANDDKAFDAAMRSGNCHLLDLKAAASQIIFQLSDINHVEMKNRSGKKDCSTGFNRLVKMFQLSRASGGHD